MGRDKRNEQAAEHFTKMHRSMMETKAWRSLSTTAQVLYVWLKFEWRGPKTNNNGKIRLSVRQASEKMGVSINTAARAFHALQAKGFIVVREPANLGLGGEAKCPAFELTELPMQRFEKPVGRKLYLEWREGKDFPVQKAAVHNSSGKNRKKPVTKMMTPCRNNGDV